LLQGGILQRLAPPADRDGAQQQPPERRAERCVAAFDGAFRIPEQMRPMPMSA
jgi:hypothetical protein